jgi:hypothetical protein
MSAIYFGGSRSLVFSLMPGQVVRAVLASGHVVHVGCSVGADQQVIQSVLAAGGQSFLVVFAVFAAIGQGGAQSALGAWSGSAVCSVYQAACVGASVRWLAGGGLQLPLVARLIRRSQAALAGCAASVFFLSSPSSRGSLVVASHAVAAGQPVYAFCASLPNSPRGCSGFWQPAYFFGFPCWQWHAPLQPSLF